ncbi:MAG: hypothetical protein NVV60_11805 [Luteimonas sp.]|nr:hypothetical protein [Luteimonas sp.]
MRTLALAILLLLSLSAHGSRPIMEDEAVACISGGTPGRSGELHSVSFNDGEELPDILGPDTLASAVVLKSSERHSAVFKVDDLTTQTIYFRFNQISGNNVCFRYDNPRKIWTIGETPAGMCQDCSLGRNGT